MGRTIPSAEPSGDFYYHGTKALAAVCISIDGFRLLPTNLRRWGYGAIGNGIYVTQVLNTASYFADSYVFRVRMRPGARILRLDGQYDRSVIQYLSREFGKEVLSPHFDRAIPKNKHLTRTELIHLANYLWKKEKGFAAWSSAEEQGPMRRYLMQHKYDGMGCLDSDLGVVVFNPSTLQIEELFRLNPPAGGYSDPHTLDCLSALDPAPLAVEAAASLVAAAREVDELRKTLESGAPESYRGERQYLRDQFAGYCAELPRWRSCLRTFCERHAIPLTRSAIASALRD